MDEPFSNLDSDLKISLRTMLSSVRAKTNSSFIYVTHDKTEALSLADRIMVLRNGKVQQISSPGEMFAKPANMFVARSVSVPKMNFIPSRYLKNENGVLINGKILKFDGFKNKHSIKADEDKDIYIGIRSDKIHFSENGFIDVGIESAQFAGSHVNYYLKYKNGQILLTEVIEKKDNSLMINNSTNIELKISFSLDDAFFFDAITEDNLEEY